MTNHTVSETNPVHVTSADSYRISITALLTPDHAKFAVMEETIKPEHRHPDGYGLALLESEEHSVMYVGPVRQITDYHAAKETGGATLDVTQGVMYDRWPHGEGWNDYIPRNTWTRDGEGIITSFTHPQGGKVYVYEYVKTDDDGNRTPMVTFHCEQCHNISEGFGGGGEGARENRGPHDRRWTARLARIHIRRPEDECRPTDPRFAEAVTAAMNADDGGNRPVVTAESSCATRGACSRIRHFRAAAG